MRVLVIVQTTASPSPSGMFARSVPTFLEATTVAPFRHTTELV
jgi:hypothetical protein